MATKRQAAHRQRRTTATNRYPYVRCHVLRHTFEAVGAIPGIQLRPRYGALITWRCLHCSTIRLDVVGRAVGNLMYRQYIHPDDYSHERMTMNDWRVLLMQELPTGLIVDLGDEG